MSLASVAAAADRADEDGQGATVRAERTAGGAVLYSLPLSAVDADLDVRGVVDQAVRTQRAPLVVTGGWLAAGAAAYAFFDAGLGDAVAADPLTVERLVDVNYPVAARAGRSDDPGKTSLVQKVDEPQDGAMRGEMGLGGQQARVLLQGPDHALAIVGTVGDRRRASATTSRSAPGAIVLITV
ncbi:hypothetical protein [Streptomyces sp. NPDC002403]